MAAVVEAAGADTDLDALVETLRETEFASTTVPDAARDSLTARPLTISSRLSPTVPGAAIAKLDHTG